MRDTEIHATLRVRASQCRYMCESAVIKLDKAKSKRMEMEARMKFWRAESTHAEKALDVFNRAHK